MYVCMYIYIYIYIYVRKYIHTYVRTYISTYARPAGGRGRRPRLVDDWPPRGGSLRCLLLADAPKEGPEHDVGHESPRREPHLQGLEVLACAARVDHGRGRGWMAAVCGTGGGGARLKAHGHSPLAHPGLGQPSPTLSPSVRGESLVQYYLSNTRLLQRWRIMRQIMMVLDTTNNE